MEKERAKEKKEKQKTKKKKKEEGEEAEEEEEEGERAEQEKQIRNEREARNWTAAKSPRKGLDDVSCFVFILRFRSPNIGKIGPKTSPNQFRWPRGTIYLVMRVSGGAVGAAWGRVRSSSGAMWGRKGAQLGF